MVNSSTSTRSSRRAFSQLYGKTALAVVSRIARGWTSDRISDATDVPVTSVAAFRANVTRGNYAPFVNGDLVHGFGGNCNF